MTFRSAAALFMSLYSGVAYADAVLQPMMGGAMVSHGQGYQRVTAATTLQSGDRVFVTQGNAAALAYPDGCRLDVRPGVLRIVGPVSPCASAQVPDDLRDRCARATSDDERARLRCPPAGLFGDATPGLGIAAGVAILGGTAAALALSESNGTRSSGISP